MDILLVSGASDKTLHGSNTATYRLGLIVKVLMLKFTIERLSTYTHAEFNCSQGLELAMNLLQMYGRRTTYAEQW